MLTATTSIAGAAIAKTTKTAQYDRERSPSTRYEAAAAATQQISITMNMAPRPKRGCHGGGEADAGFFWGEFM
jgi:hypothetical protein